MFIRLLLAFSLIPLIELALLIKVGSLVGVWWTILLVAGTGLAGATLARSQGFKLFTEVKQNLQQGQIPSDHLIEGLLLLIGAILLFTPGLLTDFTGFILIIPVTRRMISRLVKAKLKHWLEQGKLNISYGEYRDRSHTGFRGYSENTAGHSQDKDDPSEPSIDVDFQDIGDK